MEDELFDNLIQSLNEAVAYSQNDKSKGRSMVVNIPDDEIENSQILFQKFNHLSELNKQKTIQYVDSLLQASNGLSV